MRKGQHWSEEGKAHLKSLYTGEKRKEMSDTLKEVWKDPEYAKRVSETIKEAYVKDPEKGKRRSRLLKKFYKDNEEALKGLSERSKKNWQNPEFREKIISSNQKAWDDGRRVCTLEHGSEYTENCWFNQCNKKERPIIDRNGTIVKLCTNEEVIQIYKLAQPFREWLIEEGYPSKTRIVEFVPEGLLSYSDIADMFNTSVGNVYHYANKMSRKKLLKNI